MTDTTKSGEVAEYVVNKAQIRAIPSRFSAFSATARLQDRPNTFAYIVIPLLVTVGAWLTGGNAVTWPQALLSYTLLQVAWAAWTSWKQQQSSVAKGFPLFACLSMMYWLAYGLPLFWSQPETWRFRTGFVSSNGLLRAQVLALVGLFSVYAGMRSGIGRRFRPIPPLDVRNSSASVKYLLICLIVGIILRQSSGVVFAFGASFKSALVILVTTAPLTAYAILLRRTLMRPVPFYQRAILVAFAGGTLVIGLSSGWLGIGAAVITVTGGTFIDVHRRIPKIAAVVLVAYILFLQPAKEQYRGLFWNSAGSDSSTVSRAADWISMSQHMWQGNLSESGSDKTRSQIFTSFGRFSLLQQTANVVDLTPAIVPHQGWKMYRYMAVTLIPRFIWPDKPTINDSNRSYQVLYGMTQERDLDGISISVGMLAESYMSFGWLGSFGVMFIVGVALDCISVLMLSDNSGILMKGIGFALLPGYITVESQMAQYLGGLVQAVLLVLVVMSPIAVVHSRRRFLIGHQRLLRRRVNMRPFSPSACSSVPRCS